MRGNGDASSQRWVNLRSAVILILPEVQKKRDVEGSFNRKSLDWKVDFVAAHAPLGPARFGLDTGYWGFVGLFAGSLREYSHGAGIRAGAEAPGAALKLPLMVAFFVLRAIRVSVYLQVFASPPV